MGYLAVLLKSNVALFCLVRVQCYLCTDVHDQIEHFSAVAHLESTCSGRAKINQIRYEAINPMMCIQRLC
jgi:hypothetical protein